MGSVPSKRLIKGYSWHIILRQTWQFQSRKSAQRRTMQRVRRRARYGSAVFTCSFLCFSRVHQIIKQHLRHAEKTLNDPADISRTTATTASNDSSFRMNLVLSEKVKFTILFWTQVWTRACRRGSFQTEEIRKIWWYSSSPVRTIGFSDCKELELGRYSNSFDCRTWWSQHEICCSACSEWNDLHSWTRIRERVKCISQRTPDRDSGTCSINCRNTSIFLIPMYSGCWWKGEDLERRSCGRYWNCI